MKPKLIIAPLAALVLVLVYQGSRQLTIVSVERQTLDLRKKIAAARARSGGGGVSLTGELAADDKQPLDWKKLGGQLEKWQWGGGGDDRFYQPFVRRLEAMTTRELLAALDEINDLELSKNARASLESSLVNALTGKDPELALNHFSDRLGDLGNGAGQALPSAFGQWLQKKPGDARVWLDRQIAAGKFESKSLDGRSRGRIVFEGILVSALFSSDSEAAGRRLVALPENQRAETLQYVASGQNEKAFAQLVRAYLPEEDRTGAFDRMASGWLRDKGFQGVTALFDRIEATPAERAAVAIPTASRNFRWSFSENGEAREAVDAMRQWLQTEAPGTCDTLTGNALALAPSQGNSKFGFAEAAVLALEYHEGSGNDEVLAAFLSKGNATSPANREVTLTLIGKIHDPALREKILSKLK